MDMYSVDTVQYFEPFGIECATFFINHETPMNLNYPHWAWSFRSARNYCFKFQFWRFKLEIQNQYTELKVMKKIIFFAKKKVCGIHRFFQIYNSTFINEIEYTLHYDYFKIVADYPFGLAIFVKKFA